MGERDPNLQSKCTLRLTPGQNAQVRGCSSWNARVPNIGALSLD